MTAGLGLVQAGAEEAVVAAAEAVAGAGAETEEAEAVVEAEAVNATAGDVAGAEPEVAAAEAVVSAEAEAGAEAVNAAAGEVAGAEVEVAAAEAVLNAGAEAEARAEAREAEAVTALQQRQGEELEELEEPWLRLELLRMWLQQWVALRLIMLLEPGGLLSLSPGGQCWTAVQWRVWINGPVMLVEALMAFAMSVEVAGLRGDGQLLTELEDVSGGKGWRLSLVRLVEKDGILEV